VFSVATTKPSLAALVQGAKQSPAYLAGLFILLLLLTGCQTAKSPDEVTAAFWEALIDGNLKTAKTYATPASRDLVETEPYLENASVETGQITINGPASSVETIVTLASNEETGKSLTFNTVLAKEHDKWLVDYRQTLINISALPFNVILRSLQEIGDVLHKQLERQLPLIEKQVEFFGQELEKQLPLIKKQIESLGQELEKQLDEFGRQLEKPRPPDKQSPYPGAI
jgi:hypothetical protein